MVIAIDGPAGTGKSTIAKMLAQNLKIDGKGFTYINSGSLYRALTLGCLRAGITSGEPEKALEFAKKARLEYREQPEGGVGVWLDGEPVEKLLHGDEIDRWVSPFSAIVPLRHVVNDHIRAISRGLNAVVEGRDMTTVVFPDAEFKFYLDASVEERAKRRFEQGVSGLSLEEITRSIAERDALDRNKEEGSLKIAPDAAVLDTSRLTLNQVYGILEEKIHEKDTKHGSDGCGAGGEAGRGHWQSD
jgi:cytidylate kinase